MGARRKGGSPKGGAPNPHSWMESGVRNSRHGLRDIRVGEASHPGPHGRRTWDVSDEVLDNLERELRLIESYNEPLVRSTSGRNVVPRISSGAIGESLPQCPPVQWHWKQQVGVAPSGHDLR